MNAELEQRYEELARAYQLKMEANEQKTAFIRNMFHQIRTPLNIISGFTQVLSSSIGELSEEEIADIIISVSNTGDKIPAGARDHIFIPFTKLDSFFTEGIGLGLTLSRHIAHQLGGDITYDDTYDNGTRFIVKIPINLS